MILSFSDILSCRAKIDTEQFPIKDAMISVEDRRLAYIVLDTGSWFGSHLAMIEARLIGAISPAARSLTLLTDKTAVEAAPVLSREHQPASEPLPPILVGPLGYTVSPLMMAAAAPDPPLPVDRRARSIESRFERYSDILGMDVFGKDGQLGVVQDLFVATDRFEIIALQVTNSKQSPERQMLVPCNKLRHMADQQTHLVLDVTSNELADAPRLGAGGALTQSHLSALRDYYQ